MAWGIYEKTFSLCPTCHKKGDLAEHFFHIYPVTGKKSKFSWVLELMRGTVDEFSSICPTQYSNNSMCREIM